MKLFRIIYKLIALVLLAIIAVPVVVFLSIGSEQTTPNTKIKNYRKKWLGYVVKAVGLQVQVEGQIPNDEQSMLWVANHISWMDVAVIGTQGVGFLSKAEVRKWPIFGWLSYKSGVVFIQRGSKNASKLAGEAIAKKINAGDNILVFPEGTTSSGENISRFHARIFAPALDHQLNVQPVAVQYLNEHGQIHPKSAWDDQSFIANLFGVLAEKNIKAVVTFLPVIDSQEYQQRRKLAGVVEDQIRAVVISN